jgi:hypothetical protein
LAKGEQEWARRSRQIRTRRVGALEPGEQEWARRSRDLIRRSREWARRSRDLIMRSRSGPGGAGT